MFVAMPTAMPAAPFTRRFGRTVGRTVGSTELSSYVGVKSTVSFSMSSIMEAPRRVSRASV